MAAPRSQAGANSAINPPLPAAASKRSRMEAQPGRGRFCMAGPPAPQHPDRSPTPVGIGSATDPKRELPLWVVEGPLLQSRRAGRHQEAPLLRSLAPRAGKASLKAAQCSLRRRTRAGVDSLRAPRLRPTVSHRASMKGPGSTFANPSLQRPHRVATIAEGAAAGTAAEETTEVTVAERATQEAAEAVAHAALPHLDRIRAATVSANGKWLVVSGVGVAAEFMLFELCGSWSAQAADSLTNRKSALPV
jgi:hypothetical protein